MVSLKGLKDMKNVDLMLKTNSKILALLLMIILAVFLSSCASGRRVSGNFERPVLKYEPYEIEVEIDGERKQAICEEKSDYMRKDAYIIILEGQCLR